MRFIGIDSTSTPSRHLDDLKDLKGTGYFSISFPHLTHYRSARGHMVLSSPNRLAILVCQSVFPKGLCRLTDSRIEVSSCADSGSSNFVIQFALTSTGQTSANSFRHQLDHGQSLTEAAKPDLTEFC